MKTGMLVAALASVLFASSPSPAAAEADVRLDTGSAVVTNMLAQGCDEYIRFAGTVRFVFVRVSRGVDTFLSNVRIVDANLVGVGETSGTTYRLVEILGGTAMERDDRLVSGTNEVTLKIFGGGEIYSFKALGHLTVALNGEVTASFSDVRQEGCSA
jgi:hypothetical protein